MTVRRVVQRLRTGAPAAFATPGHATPPLMASLCHSLLGTPLRSAKPVFFSGLPYLYPAHASCALSQGVAAFCTSWELRPSVPSGMVTSARVIFAICSAAFVAVHELHGSSSLQRHRGSAACSGSQ